MLCLSGCDGCFFFFFELFIGDTHDRMWHFWTPCSDSSYRERAFLAQVSCWKINLVNPKYLKDYCDSVTQCEDVLCSACHFRVNMLICTDKNRLKKVPYTMQKVLFQAESGYWASIESVLTEAGLWALVAICSDAATNETASSTTRDPPQGTETCCTTLHGFWLLLCPVQITDGQQNQKSPWKHLPVSLETGWTVSSNTAVFYLSLLLSVYKIYLVYFHHN